MPSLREKSRQEYLRKREEQQLLLLEKRIEDEEFLFKDIQLTEKERKKMDYDRELLRLAKERMAISDNVQGYHMPEDYITEKGKLDKKRLDNVLYQRYEDEDGDKFTNEQEQWEKEQISKSTVRIGSKDQKLKNDDEGFDYVFDEEQQLDFILESTLQHKDDAKTPEVDEATRKSTHLLAHFVNYGFCLSLLLTF